MKIKLKAIYLMTVFLFIGFFSIAQVSLSVDEDASWLGYMHRFESVNGLRGAHISGESMSDLADLVAFVSNDGSQTITLKPNVSLYNSNNSYWSNGAGDGNKWLDANTYIEFTAGTFPGGALSFAANIDSHTIDSRYTLKAFIKEFTASYDYVDSEVFNYRSKRIRVYYFIYTNKCRKCDTIWFCA